ncbi:MAG: hypothetical protein GXO82_03645 [Chlorobi bacterium]|nr:hypothetical protein [Chlorobiota bacterium]
MELTLAGYRFRGYRFHKTNASIPYGHVARGAANGLFIVVALATVGISFGFVRNIFGCIFRLGTGTLLPRSAKRLKPVFRMLLVESADVTTSTVPAHEVAMSDGDRTGGGLVEDGKITIGFACCTGIHTLSPGRREKASGILETTHV